MALRTSNGTGGGSWHLGASWNGGVVPSGVDTFRILNLDTINVVTAGGAVGCAGGTIDAGGVLNNNSTAGFTLTGAVAHNGTFGMAGSGSNAVPTLMTMTGCVWTCGAAAIWNVVGTLSYTAPDCRIVGNATSNFNFATNPLISGTLTKTEFRTFGGTVALTPIYLINNKAVTTISVSDLLFNSVTGYIATCNSTNNTFKFSGNILINGCGSYDIYSSSLDDNKTNGVITVQSSTVTTNHFTTLSVFGNTYVYINENGGTVAFTSSILLDNATLKIKTCNTNSSMDNSLFLGNSSVILESVTCLQPFTNNTINTTGLIDVTFGATNVLLFSFLRYLSFKNLHLSGTGNLTLSAFSQSAYWQASRTIDFAITGGPATITPSFAGYNIQYEPILYKSNLITFLFAIQYDLNYLCPNYTALYGTSTSWTPATKTLAAGGILKIDSLGHTATGMDMAISSFAGFALATSGTATINTAQYYISFDGGVLWSGALTLAQLQTNTYIINGNTYYTDPRYNIQLRIWLTSTLGGTVTQVRVTGITYNPAVTESWNVCWNFERDEGVGFDTANDSFHQISTHKIGVPVALDGGLATISGNLTKMADDNGGADFDSTTDSLHELSHAIAAIAAAIAALLAPILRGVQWLQIMFKRYIIDRQKDKKPK